MDEKNPTPGVVAASTMATVAAVIPGLTIPAAAASPILERTIRKLIERGNAIWQDEAGELVVDPEDDEQVRLVWRYNTLVMAGVPDFNLRLVAQLVAHPYAKGPFTDRTVDDYLVVLRDLSPQEAVVIATLHRIGKDESARQPWGVARQLLVPKPFRSLDLLKAVAAQAVRSGLLITDSRATVGRSGTEYSSSPLMDDLEMLPVFQRLMQDPYAEI